MNKGIMKKLDNLFIEGVKKYLESKGVDEVRFEDLRKDWRKCGIKSMREFDELYIKRGNGWNVSTFNDRFEMWVNRNNLNRDRINESRKYTKKYIGFNN